MTELRHRATESAPTTGLSVIFAGGSAALVLTALFPLSKAASVHFYVVGAIICALAAPVIFLLGQRWSVAVIPVAVLGAIVLLGITLAVARTGQGTALSAVAFQWLAIYLAYFLPWRVAASYMALAMVALNIALIENEAHWARHTHVAITASFVALFLLLARLVEQLRRQANHDQLTGLLNRNGLVDAARSKVPRALRRGLPVTICAIDLDDFKGVNDEIGHVGADRHLVELGRQWRDSLGGRVIIARYGGNEFVLIACGIGVERFGDILDELRDQSPLRWSAGWARVTDVSTIEAALAQADEMLYQVKASRRAGP